MATLSSPALSRLLTRSLPKRSSAVVCMHLRRPLSQQANVKPPPRKASTGEEESLPAGMEMSSEIAAKNGILAVLLLSFCGGVMYYSMQKVGQAGSDADDPLAKLREEAAEAQVQRNKEEKATQEMTEMYEKFQAGEFDPDRYEDLEAEMEEKRKQKKPWWKVW